MRPSRSVPRSLATVAATLVAAVLSGCQAPAKPAPPPPAAPPAPTANDSMQAQQQLAAIDPRAKVGTVAGVQPANHLAAVSRIPFEAVKVGDAISFTGTDNRPFATGSVIDKDDHTDPAHPFLIVDYQKASSGGHDPADGDLAITIPVGP